MLNDAYLHQYLMCRIFSITLFQKTTKRLLVNLFKWLVKIVCPDKQPVRTYSNWVYYMQHVKCARVRASLCTNYYCARAHAVACAACALLLTKMRMISRKFFV